MSQLKFKNYLLFFVYILSPVFFPLLSFAGVNAPVIIQPSNSSQIVGANLQNPNSFVIPSHVVNLGQVFLIGSLLANSGIIASINNINYPAQIDAKTFYPDGSVKFAVISIVAPSFLANSSNPTIFSLGQKETQISLSDLSGYSFNVKIDTQDGKTFNFDAKQLLTQALIENKVTYWRQGGVVTEGRIEVPVTSSLRLVLDISKYSDGTYSTDIQYNNDATMTSNGGTLIYTTVISEIETPLYQSPTLTHYQYEQWHKVFFSNGPVLVNVQHDIPYLIRTGAIHNYDLSYGVEENILNNKTQILSSLGDTTRPFQNNGVTKQMSATGDRPDIGLTTAQQAEWIISQDNRAAKEVLAMADTAATIPWHFYDTCHSTWLNADNYPDLWIDGRGGEGRACDGTSGTVTQPVKNLDGWNPESAHDPSLSYIPLLFLGNRYYLDQLNAQASWAIMNVWPSGPEYGYARNHGEGLVANPANQVRAIAWGLRNIQQAAYMNPTGTTESNYFTKIVNNNYSALSKLFPNPGTETYGYLPSVGTGGLELKAWMNDYLMSAIAQGVNMNFSGALTNMNLAKNWSINRFLNSTKGGNPHDGCAYALTIKPTWAETNSINVTNGTSNGTGWTKSEGDYCQLAAMSLALIYNSTNDANALLAYNWLFTETSSLTASPFLWPKQKIAPKFLIVPKTVSDTVTVIPVSPPVQSSTTTVSTSSITIPVTTTIPAVVSGGGSSGGGSGSFYSSSPSILPTTALKTILNSTSTIPNTTIFPLLLPSPVLKKEKNVITITGLNVRKVGSLREPVFCQQPKGTSGVIIAGPYNYLGKKWTKVDFKTKCDGWVVNGYLKMQPN